jgi:hypothetical protein
MNLKDAMINVKDTIIIRAEWCNDTHGIEHCPDCDKPLETDYDGYCLICWNQLFGQEDHQFHKDITVISNVFWGGWENTLWLEDIKIIEGNILIVNEADNMAQADDYENIKEGV